MDPEIPPPPDELTISFFVDVIMRSNFGAKRPEWSTSPSCSNFIRDCDAVDMFKKREVAEAFCESLGHFAIGISPDNLLQLEIPEPPLDTGKPYIITSINNKDPEIINAKKLTMESFKGSRGKSSSEDVRKLKDIYKIKLHTSYTWNWIAGSMNDILKQDVVKNLWVTRAAKNFSRCHFDTITAEAVKFRMIVGAILCKFYELSNRPWPTLVRDDAEEFFKEYPRLRTERLQGISPTLIALYPEPDTSTTFYPALQPECPAISP